MAGAVSSLSCPECGCTRLFKAGLRYLASGETVQRYLCRECGYRFSEGAKDARGENLKAFSENTGNRQICAQVAKNLDTTAIAKIAAGIENQEIKGKLAVYIAKATQKGLSEATIQHNVDNVAWLAKTTDLNDPVKVWLKIDSQKTWSHGTKQHHASAYKNFAKIMKIPLPEDLDFNKWVLYDRLPKYIPTETEIMQLISGCNRKTAAMLQLLYETGIRSGEAWLLKWENFDFERKTLTLNAENCEKKGIPSQLKISDTLIAMLNLLKAKNKNSVYIWNNGGRGIEYFRQTYYAQRKQLAKKLSNPNLLKITLHTFRHYYACRLYHDTKDLLLVKSKLGHRNIQNTMVYTRLVDWEKPDAWIVRRPTTTEEEDALIEAGFEYVRFDEKTQTPIYRKRK